MSRETPIDAMEGIDTSKIDNNMLVEVKTRLDELSKGQERLLSRFENTAIPIHGKDHVTRYVRRLFGAGIVNFVEDLPPKPPIYAVKPADPPEPTTKKRKRHKAIHLFLPDSDGDSSLSYTDEEEEEQEEEEEAEQEEELPYAEDPPPIHTLDSIYAIVAVVGNNKCMQYLVEYNDGGDFGIITPTQMRNDIKIKLSLRKFNEHVAALKKNGASKYNVATPTELELPAWPVAIPYNQQRADDRWANRLEWDEYALGATVFELSSMPYKQDQIDSDGEDADELEVPAKAPRAADNMPSNMFEYFNGLEVDDFEMAEANAAFTSQEEKNADDAFFAQCKKDGIPAVQPFNITATLLMSRANVRVGNALSRLVRIPPSKDEVAAMVERANKGTFPIIPYGVTWEARRFLERAMVFKYTDTHLAARQCEFEVMTWYTQLWEEALVKALNGQNETQDDEPESESP